MILRLTTRFAIFKVLTLMIRHFKHFLWFKITYFFCHLLIIVDISIGIQGILNISSVLLICMVLQIV